ncbi:MAG: hypothetical protein ACP5VQ_10460 [Phycisphaerae bacterium]
MTMWRGWNWFMVGPMGGLRWRHLPCLPALAGIVWTLLGITTYTHAAAAWKSVFPNPGLTNPRMNFNLGTRVNGVDIAGTSPYLPAIPGPLSGWTIGMWHRREVLNARELVRNDRQLRDPRLGVPTYAFSTPNHKTHLAIYRDHKTHRWVYDLFEKNGMLLPNGGANLFLSAKARGGPFTMNHPIIYNLWAKISQAHISYYNSTAEKSGAVLAQVFTGFILSVQSSHPADRLTMFLQIPLADSRNGKFWSKRPSGASGVTYQHCVSGKSGTVIIENIAPPGGCPLPFRAQRGPLHHLHYRLNTFLRAVLAHPPMFRNSHGDMQRLVYTNHAHNLRNWILNSIYIGLETENRDYRKGVTDHHPQGTVSVALQVANLSVMTKAAQLAHHAK